MAGLFALAVLCDSRERFIFHCLNRREGFFPGFLGQAPPVQQGENRAVVHADQAADADAPLGG